MNQTSKCTWLLVMSAPIFFLGNTKVKLENQFSLCRQLYLSLQASIQLSAEAWRDVLSYLLTPASLQYLSLLYRKVPRNLLF